MSILSPHNQCCVCFLRELNLPGEIPGKVILLIDILWSDYDVATWPYHKWFGSRKFSRALAFPVVSRIKASSLWSSSELALGYCVSRDSKPAIGSPMFSLFEDRWVLLPEIKPSSKISKSNVRHRYFSQHIQCDLLSTSHLNNMQIRSRGKNSHEFWVKSRNTIIKKKQVLQ